MISVEQLGEKLLSWASILDDDTREQALRISRLPFVYPHVALMPDAHLGKGATVGSVVPTYRAIVPAAVGVDIGCGMLAVRTQLVADELTSGKFGKGGLDRLREMIQDAIPASAGGYNTVLTETANPRLTVLTALAASSGFDPKDYAANWMLQLGSLGAGNHFVELVRDEHDRVWTFVHSGSRGVGNKIAQHHMRAARHFCQTEKATLEDPDLAWLVEGTPEFRRYVAEMRWAQRFAWLNREEMTDRVIWCLEMFLGQKIYRIDTVHCHHNYTEQEVHGGRTVWLTRKGAVDAHEGVRGLIPGSMGDRSYVVQGLGNARALHSSPHGAGRLHSRRAARKLYTTELLAERMTTAGVTWDEARADKFLDEIPDAYKPVGQVLHDARSLVLPVHEFKQIINVKGD